MSLKDEIQQRDDFRAELFFMQYFKFRWSVSWLSRDNSKYYDGNIKEKFMDTDGRLLILEVEIGENFVILISYNANTGPEQIKTWKTLVAYKITKCRWTLLVCLYLILVSFSILK